MKRLTILVMTFGIGALLFSGISNADNYGGVGSSTREAVRAEVRKQFPASEWRWAYCVIGRESGYNPRAVNWSDANGGSHGLMQANGIHRYSLGALWAKRYTIKGGVRIGRILWNRAGRSPWGGGHYGC